MIVKEPWNSSDDSSSVTQLARLSKLERNTGLWEELMRALNGGSCSQQGFTVTGSGGLASVVGKNGAVDLATDTCSAVASVETSQNAFSKSNSCLFWVKERNGVLVIVF